MWDERKMATEPDRQAPHRGQVESSCSKVWRHERVRAHTKVLEGFGAPRVHAWASGPTGAL